MKRLATLTLAALLLTACGTTRTVTVERVTHDTLYQTQHQYDSIYIHDSVATSQIQRGDTLYIYRDRWRDRWHLSHQTDTLRVVSRDSIPVPYAVEKEVPAELTWWQQTRLHLANILLAALALVAVGWIIRKKLKI